MALIRPSEAHRSAVIGVLEPLNVITPISYGIIHILVVHLETENPTE